MTNDEHDPQVVRGTFLWIPEEGTNRFYEHAIGSAKCTCWLCQRKQKLIHIAEQ